MTSYESDGHVLPFAQSTPSADALPTMLRQLILQVLEAEFAGVVDAARNERSADRRGVRNSYRTRRQRVRVELARGGRGPRHVRTHRRAVRRRRRTRGVFVASSPRRQHQRCPVPVQRNARVKMPSPALQERLRDGLRDAWAASTRSEAEAPGVAMPRRTASRTSTWPCGAARASSASFRTRPAACAAAPRSPSSATSSGLADATSPR